jgi:hypothetical protein
MQNPETLTPLDTQETGRRQTKIKHKTTKKTITTIVVISNPAQERCTNIFNFVGKMTITFEFE